MPEIAKGVQDEDIVGCSVLSGNRNFEGRIHPLVQMNFLASPPFVVAYALAGSMEVNLYKDPLGTDTDGNEVYLKDLWPTQKKFNPSLAKISTPTCLKEAMTGSLMAMKTGTTSIHQRVRSTPGHRTQPMFAIHRISKALTLDIPDVNDIVGARALALLGDSVTTDHISPAGSIAVDSPAATYLQEKGVKPVDFNSYGSRRGNHEVMMRGTFANIRLRNQLAPGTEGGWTRHQPSDEEMSIYDASLKYQQSGTPLVIIAGTEYGTGSSRDWAAKGTMLLGVKAVITQSYERHSSLESHWHGLFCRCNSWMVRVLRHWALQGKETYDISGHTNADADVVTVTATPDDGDCNHFHRKNSDRYAKRARLF